MALTPEERARMEALFPKPKPAPSAPVQVAPRPSSLTPAERARMDAIFKPATPAVPQTPPPTIPPRPVAVPPSAPVPPVRAPAPVSVPNMSVEDPAVLAARRAERVSTPNPFPISSADVFRSTPDLSFTSSASTTAVPPPPKAKSMVFPVGEGLSNVTDVLPGPRVGTLEAIKRGEKINVTLTPSRTSDVTKAKRALGFEPTPEPPKTYDKLEQAGYKANELYETGLSAVKRSLPAKLAGVAVGIPASVIGGVVGGAGSVITSKITGQELTPERFWSDVAENARATREFGTELGESGVAQAPLAGGGKIVNALVAIPQVFQVYRDVKKGNLTPEAGINAAMTAASLFFAVKSKGYLPGAAEAKAANWYQGNISRNEIVRSAKETLAIPAERNVLGQMKKVDQGTINRQYRKKAFETHPDKGGNAQQFQAVNTAKNILEDYNTLSQSQFHAKYQKPLMEVQKIIKQLPERSQPAAPRPAPSAAKPLPGHSGLIERPAPALARVEPQAPTAPPATAKPVAAPLFHGSDSGRLKIDNNGNINLTTDESGAAAFGPVVPIDASKLTILDVPSKEYMFQVTADPVAKQELISRGFDTVQSDNHAIVIAPLKVAGTLGLPVRENLRTKSIEELVRAAEPVAPQVKAEPTLTLPAPKEKPLEPYPIKNTEGHERVINELVFAERGKRVAVEKDDSSGYAFSAQRSTFPTWVPSELRRRPLFDAVLQHLSSGTVPTKAAERRLYRVVVDELKKQDQIVDEQTPLQAARKNLIDPFATEAENAAALAKFDTEYAKSKSVAQTSREAAPEARQEVAPAQEARTTPQEDGLKLESKKSGVGKSIESKSIERGLVATFSDTAQYDPVTIKDQAERAAKLLSEDIERAKRIVLGEEKLPDGLLAGTMIKAMEDYALETGDAYLALGIANSPLTSETSIHAQEMRMLAERDPDSAVANIKKLQQAKKELAQNKGKTQEKVVEQIRERIKKEPKAKATKETWASFIDSITC